MPHTFTISTIRYGTKSERGQQVLAADLAAWWHRIKTSIKLWTPLISVSLPALLTQSFT